MTVPRLRALATAAGARLSRTRALWLGAAVLVLATAGYLLSRRSRRPASAPPVDGPVGQVPALTARAPVETVAPPVTEEPADVPLVDGAAAEGGEPEKPLATPIRVAIVAAALIAFFAISLLATKRS